LSPWFDERGERQAQLIGQLSGLDFGDSPLLRGLDPRSLRDQAFAAVRLYLRALAARGGALPVLIVEDLHWADDGSLDLLQHLQEHAAALPLALVMTARPALLTRRPDWGTNDGQLLLSALATTQSDALAQALLQRIAEVPQTLTELIVSRAEGNPYYMEELVRRLIDDGAIVVAHPHWTVQLDRLDSLSLPGTLVGLLQARLDALPTAQRLAARQASVIGHVFWDDALKAVDAQAPQSLAALQRAAFVKDHDSSDFEGTPERQFDHHLLHQVTYDTLLKAERRLGHAAAARWLQARTRGRGAEFLAMTGEHAERAGETALAIDCFEQAGKEAQKRFAHTAASAWLRRAARLLGESEPARRCDLLALLGDIADTVGDRAGQDTLLAERAALLERHPDGQRQAEWLFNMALLADRRGDSSASEPLAQQAFEQAERSGSAITAALAQGQLTWLNLARHDDARAARHVEIGMRWAARIPGDTERAETEAKLLTLSGMVALSLDQFEQARSAFTAVVARGEALGLPRLEVGALDNLAIIANYTGRWQATAASGERMRKLGQSIGSPRAVGLGQLRLAEAADALGDPATAIRWHEQSLAIWRAIEDQRMQAIILRFLAALRLRQGEVQAALACCAEALTLHQTVTDLPEACEIEAYVAHCEFLLGRTEAAQADIDRLVARMARDLAGVPGYETLGLRWACQQVLAALGDGRAAALLEQLHADVQARATVLTDAADRDRLIQAVPAFRAIVAAHGRRGEPAAAP
jgi:tetratricopeptide (TPR) repeat protein